MTVTEFTFTWEYYINSSMCWFPLAQKAKVDNKENSAKIKFAGGGGRLDDDQSDCAEDITRLCPEIPKGNNFALLVCLQEKAKVQCTLYCRL